MALPLCHPAPTGPRSAGTAQGGGDGLAGGNRGGLFFLGWDGNPQNQRGI